MTRRAPNMSEKLASMSLWYLDAIGQGIPHEHQQILSAEQINSLFDWDHYPKRYADGGTTHPSNLKPLFRGEHREKTAKIDVPEIAKGKRILAREEEFRRRVLAKERGEPKPPSRWGKRPFNRRASRG